VAIGILLFHLGSLILLEVLGLGAGTQVHLQVQKDIHPDN
jgi:hypothetical protein